MNSPATLPAEAAASECFAAMQSGARVTPFTARDAGFDLPRAYASTAALRRLRVAAGERPVGRKIGFTNRALWERYSVYAPIWGDMYASTVHEIANLRDGFSLAGFHEPQIEPEIAFKLASAPQPEMDAAALIDCVEWVAHGFEVVQSPFPEWKFQAPDVVASGGLHGAMLLGPPESLSRQSRDSWVRTLGSFSLDLLRDGVIVDSGEAANVLDHPLNALRHLVALLAQDAHNPPLATGEIITTGTVTRAFPIAPGERWETRLRGIELSDIGVTFR